MPFSNPANITALIGEVDFFTWPCLSGEKYPPTMSAGAYGTKGLLATVQMPPTGTAASINWPSISAVGPNSSTFNGYVFTGKIWVQRAAGLGGIFSTLASGNGPIIRCEHNTAAAGVPVSVWNGSAYVSLGTLTESTWYQFTITVSAAGAVTYTIGTLSASWLPVGIPTAPIKLAAAFAAATPAGCVLALSALTVTYN